MEAGAFADVKLPALFSDNMMLQAEKPVAIWGAADPGEKVSVSFAGQSAAAVADAQGNWKLQLKPLAAGTAGEMTVVGKNQIRIGNVLTGSVWICSGQSNMEMGIKGARNRDEEIANANYPKIRLFLVSKSARFQPQMDVEAKWVECTPTTVAEGGWYGFSAAAYFFGREIHKATGLPVGLIQSAYGGSMAQSWTSLDGLKKIPEAGSFVRDYEKKIVAMAQLMADYETRKAGYPARLAKWEEEVNKPFQIQFKEWQKAASQAKAAGQPEPPRPKLAEAKPGLGEIPDKDPWSPVTLWNAMIAPLVPYAIEGVIWYQGESNRATAKIYEPLFQNLIRDWREKFGQGDIPFYYCQLANYLAKNNGQPGDSVWATLREIQRKTLALPNTGMAVLIDTGEEDDIHPRNKQEAGRRLARIALAKTYGKGGRYTGPVVAQMKVEGNKARLSFDPVGGELVAAPVPEKYIVKYDKDGLPITKPVVRNRPGSPLEGFAICGADRKWVWADAVIEGQTVVVSAPEVAAPVTVRYGWDSNPTCNLYNKEGLPASPFQAEAAK